MFQFAYRSLRHEFVFVFCPLALFCDLRFRCAACPLVREPQKLVPVTAVEPLQVEKLKPDFSKLAITRPHDQLDCEN